MAKIECTVRDGKFVEPCEILEQVTEYGHPRGKQKGIYAWAWSNREGPTRTMFGVKSGDRVTPGILFNFCPFCGKSILIPDQLEQSK